MKTTSPPASEFKTHHVFLLLAGYFILHLITRVLISNGAELDEAEQLLLTQELRLGYGSQPPLYTWLQSGFFYLFGTNVFSLAAMKNSLLFLTYSFVYLGAREVTNDTNRAITAMLSLLLIPQILWESQRDLTHSVLGTTIAACTLFLMLRMLKTGKLHYYLFFGLCAGIGIISKYNYGIFLIALIVSALSVQNLRHRLLNARFLLSLACLLLIAAPHVYWVTTHLKATLSQAGKFQVKHSLGLLASYTAGLWSLCTAVISFLGLLIPGYLLFFYRKGSPGCAATQRSDAQVFIQRSFLSGMILCILMILLFKVTVFKDRWMQPLLFMTPICLVTLSWPVFTPGKARRYACFAFSIAAVVLLLMPGRTLFASPLGIYSRLSAPYSSLASQLQNSGFRRGAIIAQSRLMGGNLKLFFPDSVVLAPEIPLFTVPALSDMLIVWDATTTPEMPDHLREFIKTVSPDDPGILHVQYIQSRLNYYPEKTMRLGFILIGKKTL